MPDMDADLHGIYDDAGDRLGQEWEDETEWDGNEKYDRSLDCVHEQADIDILTGRAVCSCGYSWLLSAKEIQQEADFQAAYFEAMAEDESNVKQS